MTVTAKSAGARRTIAQDRVAFTNEAPRTAQGLASPAWSLESAAGTVAVEDLAWNRGHENWFFRHFDHAALVVTDYLLDGNPLLRGRILDVGCGDGITDLGIFLRYQPEEMVGIDPFSGFDRLGKIVTDNHLPRDVLESLVDELLTGADRLGLEVELLDVLEKAEAQTAATRTRLVERQVFAAASRIERLRWPAFFFPRAGALRPVAFRAVDCLRVTSAPADPRASSTCSTYHLVAISEPTGR